jgi:hypothetical protein
MDPATVAVSVSTFLGPFLPYLLKGGEEAAKEAGKALGAVAWDRAQVLWGKLRPKVEASPDAKRAVERAAERPEDKRVAGSLELELDALLGKEPGLAAELAELLDEAKAAGVNVTASGERAVAIGGNVTGGTIATGDQCRPPESAGR